MNTENEYQLIKATYEIVKNAECEKTTYKDINNHHKKQHKALKDLKLRLFILNLNMRPVLPLPEEIQMKIKRTALIDQLKHTTIMHTKIYPHILRKNDIIKILRTFRFPCKKIGEPPYYKGQKDPYMKVCKKEALQDMLNQNNIEWKKSWNVKKLMDAVIKM